MEVGMNKKSYLFGIPLVFAVGMSCAGSWSSGSGFTWLNPTSDKLGVGFNTTPSEKFQVVGGSILIDNTKNYKGKTGVGNNSINLIGAYGTSASIYDNKITVTSDGRVGIGITQPFGNIYGATGIDVSGYIQSTNDITSSTDVIADHTLGGNYVQSNNDVYAGGSIYASHDLTVYGTKNFAQIDPKDATKQIVYVSAEAGEALTLARGNAKTENGAVTVKLPEHYSLVTSDEVPLTVQLTVEKVPALIYVASKSKDSIEVRVKPSDYQEFGDVEFDYFVQGVRDGFEDHQVIQDVNPENKPALSEKHRLLNERVSQVLSPYQHFHKKHPAQ